MMSLVVHTAAGNAIIIDDGQPEDPPLLRELLGGRPANAWIMTHPHLNHITGLIKAMKDGDTALRPERGHYNFPSLEFIERTEPDRAWTLRYFLEIRMAV